MTQPTIFDVAARAGVSKSTVSKVLTRARYVSDDARARVEAAIDELQYHPSAAARRLQSRRSRLLGLIMPRIAEPPIPAGFFSAFMFGAGEAAAMHGYDLVWHVSLHFGGAMADDFARRFLQREVDGLVLANMLLEDPRVAALLKADCPFVLVGRYVDPQVYTVDIDNIAVGRLATDHLLEQGHRRIGLLNGMAELPFCQDRHQGYQAALADSAVQGDPTLVSWQPFRESAGYDAMRRLLAAGVRAVIVTDAALRAGCLRALHEQGVAVPSQCSVVGIEDVAPDQEQFGLTAVIQPTGALAAAAVEMVMQMLSGKPPVRRRLLLAPRLFSGASTSPDRN
ncbi:MAG TPA: LacI family DNA-binding transcriptional regulator [Chloroflexota bacterium]|nr:LacI family DNA-binding transcriptional regulator [Chloroflexota bacterium]